MDHPYIKEIKVDLIWLKVSVGIEETDLSPATFVVPSYPPGVLAS